LGQATFARFATAVRGNKVNYIDAHVHVWTPDIAHYPLAEGYKRENMQPRSFTPEELFKHSRPAGVNRINLIQMSFYAFDMP
jgi:predicted TIM-barrel fold metal-dependent hydrolase